MRNISGTRNKIVIGRRPWYVRLWRRISGRDRMVRRALKIIKADRTY